MKYLWDEITSIKNFLRAHDKIVLLLDFDGTLVPILQDKKKVHLTQTLRKLLISVKDNPDLFLGIVSGRKLSNIKHKVGINNIIFVGSHGWEWEIAGQKNNVKLDGSKSKTFNDVKKKMEKLVQQFTGTSIEEKYCSFSVHYRFADNPYLFQRSFLKLVKADTQFSLMKIMKGKKVYDILPDYNWRKGHAVSLIIKKMNKLNRRNHLLYIYIGDDTTDEKVFNMHSRILTIRVGKNHLSKAKYYVKSTTEVRKFLELIKNYHLKAENFT